jgi:hypothetical protein
MKERAEWEDTTTVLLSVVGAIGGMWMQSIGAGVLAFVVLLVSIARLVRR